MLRRLALRYATWIDAHRTGIIVLSVLVAVLAGYLTSRMPLRSDLSSLLPDSRSSVHDLRALQQRATAFGRVFIMVEARDREVRRRAAEQVRDGLLAINSQSTDDPIGFVVYDDSALYQHVWRHRFLYADLGDLERARDALARRIERAKLLANPLYIDIDDESSKRDRAESDREIAAMRDKLARAERQATTPTPPVSADGTIQLITVHTSFASSDQKRGTPLLDAIDDLLERVARDNPGVEFGVTGTVPMSLAEHRSIVGGMVTSGAITLVLCAIAVLLFYRSRAVVGAIVWSLSVGVLATLGVTWLFIGHLNVMSAFLTAIVIGNGINPGLIFVARWYEEAGRTHEPRPPIAETLGATIAGAFPGTVTAMATASVAYTSLVISDFRGFRHFGMIAGVGMGLTWLAAFTVLPALLAVIARRRRLELRQPALGRWLKRVIPKRPGGLLIAAIAITGLGVVLAVGYIAGDPFTNDWRELSVTNREIAALRALDQKLADAIPGSSRFSGLSYQLVLGVDERAQVAPLVSQLRAIDRGRPPERQLLLDVRSIDDLLPADQDKKLAVLAAIRKLADDDLVGQLAPDERAEITKLRPPDNLRRLGDGDLPPQLAWPFIERTGIRGRLIAVRGAPRFQTWNMNHRQQFAAEFRQLTLPRGVLIGGEALVIADIVDTMEDDTPVMISIAVAGSILVVLVMLGMRRHAAVTIASGFAGVAVMIAGCAIAGLHVHFLDVIALPITIGVGIEYAANLAARDREAKGNASHDQLAATAGAVVLCSYTTTVGYGSLLLSANGGIRSFGLAAILGELSCVFTAMILAPSLLILFRRHRANA